MTPTAHAPSTLARAMTWLVVALTALLLAWGIVQYGFSLEVRQRFWGDIFGRVSGPMTFRLFLQPIMALIAALPDGINDARNGHSSFYWTASRDTSLQRGRLRQGLLATARIMLLGLSMDVIYQFKVFNEFYPVEALVFALALAVVPYFIWRWIVERIARRWQPRTPRSG